MVGISLGGACRLRFQRGKGGERRVWELLLEPRSGYVLTGKARTSWQHSIPGDEGGAVLDHVPDPAAVTRCGWVPLADPLYLAYHDEEWGVPTRDDRELFELLTLEGAQAGLSWSTILRKREGYRRAFGGFDPEAVARFGPADVERLLADTGIVRNRLKVESTVANARAVLELDVPLSELLWSFVGGEQRVNAWPTVADIPAETPESKAMSKELKRRGFRFVGPTVCYALMQAAGLVDDHTADCYRSGAASAASSRSGSSA